MRVVSATALLALTGCAGRMVAPATLDDLRAGEEIAGFRYHFTTAGRYRVEGDFYEMREALNGFEAAEAQARGDITGFAIDIDVGFWRYEGIAGGDLHTVEFVVQRFGGDVYGIRAVPDWPDGVVGVEARLAHLGLTLGDIVGVGVGGTAPYEGRHPGIVLAQTGEPGLLVGLDAASGEVELAWIVRAVGDDEGRAGLARQLDVGLAWVDVASQARERFTGGTLDWDWLDSTLPALVAAAVTPEGAALSAELQQALVGEIAAATEARAGVHPLSSGGVAALGRACRAVAALARLRPLDDGERASLAAAFDALAAAFDGLAAGDPSGGGAALQAAAAYARSLGADAGRGDLATLAALPRDLARLVPLLDAAAGDADEPVWPRALRLVGDLDVVVDGHASDPRVRGLAEPTFALVEGWAAAMQARGLTGAAAWLRLGVDHAAGRIPELAKPFRATMASSESTAAQRDALALFGRVVGAPAPDVYAAPAFEDFVDRVELLRRGRGARVYAQDASDIAWLAREVGGPELVFERSPVAADVREGVVGYAVWETHTTAVEVDVDTTEQYAARDLGLAELEEHLAWIEVERAKVLADMPMAVSDDDVVLDRVTGMAIGPNTGSGKYLNQKRARLQERLDQLDTSRRVSIAQYGRLSGTVPEETRTEVHTETVERVHNLIVYQGLLTARHQLDGGGATARFVQIREIPDVRVDHFDGVAAVIASYTDLMHEEEESELAPLLRRWLDARLEAVLEEGRAANGWDEAELAVERAALTEVFSTR